MFYRCYIIQNSVKNKHDKLYVLSFLLTVGNLCACRVWVSNEATSR